MVLSLAPNDLIGETILTTLGNQHHIFLPCETLQVATFARKSQESAERNWINPNEVMVMLWVFSFSVVIIRLE